MLTSARVKELAAFLLLTAVCALLSAYLFNFQSFRPQPTDDDLNELTREYKLLQHAYLERLTQLTDSHERSVQARQSIHELHVELESFRSALTIGRLLLNSTLQQLNAAKFAPARQRAPPTSPALTIAGAECVSAGDRRTVKPSEHRLALVLPARNHRNFTLPMTRALRAQLWALPLDYRLVVSSQANLRAPFNRGKLLNIAVEHGREFADYFCFHALDLWPAEPFIDLSFAPVPRHIAVNRQSNNWSLLQQAFDGVACVGDLAFLVADGYSNDFWGVGLEDFDFECRLQLASQSIEQADHGRYFHLTNFAATIADSVRADGHDGCGAAIRNYRVNGLSTLDYNLIDVVRDDIFTVIHSDLVPPLAAQ